MQAFARAVHIPFGYLFLTEPPDETVPIPDFRTLDSQSARRPSPNLLDTIYDCQERQDWYREFARSSGALRLDFVGSISLEDSPETVALLIRTSLGVDLPAQRKRPHTDDLLRSIAQWANKNGIPDRKTLEAEAAAWEKRRNEEKGRTSWMFTVDKARDKMGKDYPTPKASKPQSRDSEPP
ncbi:MAG: hypothetical protein OXB95_11790 [Rhodobacteraceae bacterium]|nr:hypothetical protein [Paracoccaceae bacterium]